MTSSDSKRLWRRAVKQHFNCQCVYCGKHYEEHELTLDHVKPLSRGGETLTKNIVCACKTCNQDKGSRNWLHWMRARFGHDPHRERTISDHIAA